ncbi:ATP-dependent RNA helicase DHX33-like [Branchiostoma floridae x Branchiostoma japonicum]
MVEREGEIPTPKKRKYHHNVSMSPVSGETLRRERLSLPIYPARRKIIQQVQRLDTVILIGETGSGKTTQIPQYLMEAGFGKVGTVACTQPRRVAAVTVATRVSKERGCELGAQVGYCVRFDDMTSENTKIKYMTDGMLLREAIGDPLLKRYSVVILDEAHERTIQTDILFGVVKAAQKRRKESNHRPLKVIVMSATMDVDHFSQYFNRAPVLYLEGRQHPVKVMYAREPQEDCIYAALVTVFQLHQEVPPQEDVLVFLTGQEEIETLARTMRDIAHHCPSDAPGMVVRPLYAALPPAAQLKAFEAAPTGTRKVILATNIAETSVTIKGIKHVVDTAMVKQRLFRPTSGLDSLVVKKVSKAQAWQRTGRAGRESSGTCYRLLTEEEFEQLSPTTTPEIQRVNLASVVLQLLALRIHDIMEFDFMDKPTRESLLTALQQLHLLGAVEKQQQVQLTPLGRLMAAFPLDPRFAKVILAAKDHHCTEEILTIVAMLSVDSVLFTPASKRELAAAVRRKFMSEEGDHIMLLNIYRAFKAVKGNRQWCQENFVNSRNVSNAMDIRGQLRDLCQRLQIPLESAGQDTAVIRTCLAKGLFMNAAELQRGGEYITVETRQPVAIHPSSCLFQCKPAYVIFSELVQTTKCYMRDLSVVDQRWLQEAAPNYFKQDRT